MDDFIIEQTAAKNHTTMLDSCYIKKSQHGKLRRKESIFTKISLALEGSVCEIIINSWKSFLEERFKIADIFIQIYCKKSLK